MSENRKLGRQVSNASRDAGSDRNDRRNDPRNPAKKRKASHKRQGKKFEVNIPDADVNAADLGPIDKERSKANPNDFSWYNHYPVLAENCSGVNYALAVGAKINYFNYGAGLSQDQKFILSAAEVAPGICTIYYIPTYGKLDKTVEAPLSRVYAQLYSAMRIKLGSRADYDPTDTLIYTIAMDSAYLVYGLAVKAYGMTNMVSPFNMYMLQKNLEAAGFEWKSISRNRAAFRDLINQYAIAISKYMVPSDLDLFKRRMWMVQNMFTDSNTAKSQLYHFMPEGFYLFNETVEQGDKVLKYVPLQGTGLSSLISFGDFENWFNMILLSLESSQDVVQMSADVAKAWEGKTLAAALIPESYTTPVGYSQEVLSQIENIVLVGNPRVIPDITSPNITVENDLTSADGPRLEQDLWFSGAVGSTGGNAAEASDRTRACYGLLSASGILNFHWASPVNQDTIVASRGTVYGKRVGKLGTETLDSVQLGSYGTEVYTKAKLTSMMNGEVASTFYSYFAFDSISAVHSWWTSFDWAPAYFNCLSNRWTLRMQDLDMYGVIDHNQIDMLHYNCILSEFYSDIYPESIVNMPWK